MIKIEIEIENKFAEKHDKVLSFLSSMVAALKVFRKDASKKLNLSKLRRYLNQLLGAKISEQEMKKIISIIIKLERILHSHFQDFSFVLTEEHRELKLSLEEIQNSNDFNSLEKKTRKQHQTFDALQNKKIKIKTSELKTLSDLFELFTIQKFKGFNINGLDSNSSKALRRIKSLSSKYPFFFTQRDNLMYFSPLCFNLIKDFSKYQKLRRGVSQIKVKDIIFLIQDS